MSSGAVVVAPGISTMVRLCPWVYVAAVIAGVVVATSDGASGWWKGEESGHVE